MPSAIPLSPNGAHHRRRRLIPALSSNQNMNYWFLGEHVRRFDRNYLECRFATNEE
jgi:hypothetical protein